MNRQLFPILALLALLNTRSQALHFAADTVSPTTQLYIGGYSPRIVQKAMHYIQNFKEVQQPDHITKEECDSLRNGDIVLRQGMGGLSAMLADMMGDPQKLTHSGFLFKDKTTEQWTVIHCQPDDTKKGSIMTIGIEDFARYAVENSLLVLRPKNQNPQQAQACINRAHGLMNLNIPFDFYFNTKDDSRLYCFEMIKNILEEVHGRDLLPKRRVIEGYEVVTLDNFLNAEEFEVVLCHLPLELLPEAMRPKKKAEEDENKDKGKE